MRVANDEADEPGGGVPGGAALRRFARAIVVDHSDVDAAREACIAELGESATVQAAAVVASFDGINRVADATGISVDAETYERGGTAIVEELHLDRIRGDRA